ncbi:MAG TPA: GTP cyclohydrolase I FolE [Chthoniobacterales bacterium]|nr:GTP cyclohydrolase I FolE [Chthoniobacterales bacterium]
MSEANCSSHPALNGTVLPGRNGTHPHTASPAEVFRSFTAHFRRQVRTVAARFNGPARPIPNQSAFRRALPAPRPDLEPLDLSAIDSKQLVREILRRVGEDPDREGLRQTPDRIVRSWKELYAGYGQRAEEILLTQFQAEQYDEMVLLRDFEFFSTCEHHMLPFSGKAHIAYLPNEKIVGLSKLARLTDMFARRLQVQERLTWQIATELERVLKPKGVAVMIEAKHQCMCSRGVRKQQGKMVTSCLLGAFHENLASRTEFLALVKG